MSSWFIHINIGLLSYFALVNFLRPLRECLSDCLERKSHAISEKYEKDRLCALLGKARASKDFWVSFSILKESLGRATYTATVRERLQVADACAIPQCYKSLWKLPLDGFLNLNLDRLASRSHSEEYPGKAIHEFPGKNASSYVYILKSQIPFIVNLHGTTADESSWVFTNEELKDLLGNTGYREFIRACLCTKTVLFVGITPDDLAVRSHLEKLRSDQIDFGQHFWITNRTDHETYHWAESLGIRIIKYSSDGGRHNELDELFDDLSSYTSEDAVAPPVSMENESATEIKLPRLDHLLSRSDNEIREILNAHASNVLSRQDEKAYTEYLEFCKNYDPAIYRAWYVTTAEPNNKLFEYELLQDIKEGAFGMVYRAKNREGADVAIKLLRENVRRKSDMLQCFRRGVRSMRILSKHKLDGMVPYHEASEIPAFAVMDFIEGPNLSEAVNSQYCTEWDIVIKIAVALAHIIRKAHQLPERVLHRDIRPANIMLKDYYADPDNWQIVVLDFDLSWHMGAMEVSIIDRTTLNGYLAPEQVDRHHNASTRNAAVDSFGLGMTLYYLRTARDPQYLEHRHRGWEDNLREKICSCECGIWKSLPIRYSRLIFWATQDVQSERWDMSQIEKELEQLEFVIKFPSFVESAELISEELSARVCKIKSLRYKWDIHKSYARVDLVSGVSVIFSPNEIKREVCVGVSWAKSESHEYKEVNKYLKSRCEQSIALMNRDGWKTSKFSLSGVQASFEASMHVKEIRGKMDLLSISISKIVDLLSF